MNAPPAVHTVRPLISRQIRQRKNGDREFMEMMKFIMMQDQQRCEEERQRCEGDRRDEERSHHTMIEVMTMIVAGQSVRKKRQNLS